MPGWRSGGLLRCNKEAPHVQIFHPRGSPPPSTLAPRALWGQWSADQRQAILRHLARLLEQQLAEHRAQQVEEEARDDAEVGR